VARRRSQEDSLAFESLRKLQRQLTGQDESWFLIKLGWYRDKTGKVFSGGAFRSMVTDIEYEHLIHLLCRDWFRRTWVIQEVASARNATVFCGNQSISWETLAEVFMRLGDHFLPVSQFGGEEPQHSLENITAIETARRFQSGPLSMSLFHILVATSFSKCKENRDKIFAVIGLARDSLGKRTLIPDYDTKEDNSFEVFKDFAVADSNTHRDLRTLSCASDPGKSQSLPSWVPNWTEIQNPYPFVRYSDRTKFCASGRMQAEAWHSNNETVLRVTGKLVDSVAILGSEPKFTKAVAVFEINKAKITELANSFKWLQDCRDLASDSKGRLTKNRHQKLWRTLMCGLTGDAFPVPIRYSEYFDKYMIFMETAAQTFEDYLLEAQTTVTGIRGLDETIPHFETHALIEASLSKWSSRRRLCKTRKGRLACVPKSSKRGDVICTLFGAEVPYVLRPMAKGFYTVIGECYVDDIMHGESLSDNRMLRNFRLL
jgi:hypothetical protein